MFEKVTLIALSLNNPRSTTLGPDINTAPQWVKVIHMRCDLFVTYLRFSLKELPFASKSRPGIAFVMVFDRDRH